jgi:hypothetical protein
MNKLLFKRRKCNQTGPYSCRKNNEVFLLDYKTGIHNAIPATIRKLSKAIELMGYKVIKKALIYIGKEIEVVNL